LDSAAFEQKVGGGFIAINWENKFSEPGATTVLDPEYDVKRKYELMMNAYKPHLVGGKYAGRTRSAVGELQLKSEDVFLVVCSWRHCNVKPPNNNVIILTRTELERLYSPSLVSRPHFLWREADDERVERLIHSNTTLQSVTVDQLRGYCERRGIEISGNQKSDYAAAIKERIGEGKVEQERGDVLEPECSNKPNSKQRGGTKRKRKTSGKKEQNGAKKSKTENDLKEGKAKMEEKKEQNEGAKKTRPKHDLDTKEKAIKEKILAGQPLDRRNGETVAALKNMQEGGCGLHWRKGENCASIISPLDQWTKGIAVSMVNKRRCSLSDDHLTSLIYIL